MEEITCNLKHETQYGICKTQEIFVCCNCSSKILVHTLEDGAGLYFDGQGKTSDAAFCNFCDFTQPVCGKCVKYVLITYANGGGLSYPCCPSCYVSRQKDQKEKDQKKM